MFGNSKMGFDYIEYWSVIMKFIFVLVSMVLLQGCFGTKYELKKYYRDPTSAAALIMGGTYAGVVETFNSMDACLQMKSQAEQDDHDIGYTNSRFVCDTK